MKTIMTFLCVIYASAAFSIDIDFSKSFIISESSGTNAVTIGGIDAAGNSYRVDFKLLEDLTLAITDAAIQNTLSNQLEQQLRNTRWQGTYKINDDNFATNLTLVVVQDGYVGGEIIHSEPAEEGGGFLHVRVTGDIITQFFIDGSFIDEDRIAPEIIGSVTEETVNRQLIRIKRMRAFDFKNESDASGSHWNTNREYRLVLENGILSGTVGIPNDRIGSGDKTTQNGLITLTRQQ